MLKSDANQPALISGSSLKSGFPDDQAEFPDLRTPVKVRCGPTQVVLCVSVLAVLYRRMFVCDLYLTSHAPQHDAAWVSRSGGPSRDGRWCRRPGGSVGRAPRPPICFSALCAAGRSVWTCRVGNRSFYYRGSVGRDARFTFNFAPPKG